MTERLWSITEYVTILSDGVIPLPVFCGGVLNSEMISTVFDKTTGVIVIKPSSQTCKKQTPKIIVKKGRGGSYNTKIPDQILAKMDLSTDMIANRRIRIIARECKNKPFTLVIHLNS